MIEQLESNPNVTLSISPSYKFTVLAMNTQRAPFSDKWVRKAVSHALDLNAFCASVVKNSGTPGTVLPFGAPLYGDNADHWKTYLESAPKYDFNLDEAKADMAKSGFSGGFDCSLVTNEDSTVTDMALFIQNALKPLGINVNIETMSGSEQDTYQQGGKLDANGKRDYDMIIGGWEPDYPDLDGSISVLVNSSQAGANGYNSAAYANSQVDTLIAEQESVSDPAQRFALQKQLMDIVVDDVPYITFYYSNRESALNKKYKGLGISPAWLWNLSFQDVRRNL
jgi:peptide/nickel transport system substrate-binding protein